jgi:1-acyl-sn-glycerol-3-phosphate acyltransferase
LRSRAPAIPVYISGAFAAWPRGRHLPRLHRITVVFGHPERVAALRTTAADEGDGDEEEVAAALRMHVADLATQASANTGTARALP